MNPFTPILVTNSTKTCSYCGQEIEPSNAYRHGMGILCEDCCMDVRSPRSRKTHWQYLRSIKAGYLIPGKKDR